MSSVLRGRQQGAEKGWFKIAWAFLKVYFFLCLLFLIIYTCWLNQEARSCLKAIICEIPYRGSTFFNGTRIETQL